MHSKRIPGSLPLPVSDQPVIYTRTDVRALPPQVHCSCSEESSCCRVRVPERLSFSPTSEILPTEQVDDYGEGGHV